MAALGVIAFPLAAQMLLIYHAHGHEPSPQLDWRLQLHAWLALLAYATLGIAALLAVMLWGAGTRVAPREFHAWLRALAAADRTGNPAVQHHRGRFVLLSATLLTGIMFVEDLLSQKLVHKTVLSLLSWLAFGALLLGRSLRLARLDGDPLDPGGDDAAGDGVLRQQVRAGTGAAPAIGDGRGHGPQPAGRRARRVFAVRDHRCVGGGIRVQDFQR